MNYVTTVEDYRCLAGGATLVAMMNVGLVEPELLISLHKLDELKGMRIDQNVIRIGAMTTHTAITDEDRLTGNASLVRSAAGQIAHSAVRNMGTIGGAISHADPSADFPAALTAANATIEVLGPSGRRVIQIDDFFVNYLETSLTEKEIVMAIMVPLSPADAIGHHLKFSRVDGDYATVSVSLALAMEGRICSYARIAVGSVAAVPLRLKEADDILIGSNLEESEIARASELLLKSSDPIDDVRGSSSYRKFLIPRLIRQAVLQSKKELSYT
ncbi:MAG: xanthine dehydrogenase family protein subunit M [Gammaproteobacteria bacterium]|nr:xanthine dehydrogenase family protein subunit M [Gammaproteobacteria bacterium]